MNVREQINDLLFILRPCAKPFVITTVSTFTALYVLVRGWANLVIPLQYWAGGVFPPEHYDLIWINLIITVIHFAQLFLVFYAIFFCFEKWWQRCIGVVISLYVSILIFHEMVRVVFERFS